MVYSSKINGVLESSSTVFFYTPESLFLETYSKLGHTQEGKLSLTFAKLNLAVEALKSFLMHDQKLAIFSLPHTKLAAV